MKTEADNSQRQSRKAGYEIHDLPLWLVAAIVAAVTTGIVIAWLIPPLFVNPRQQALLGAPSRALLDEIRATEAPLLQTDPPRDYHDMIRGDLLRLHSYGWVNRQRGIVHIPIGQAMGQLSSEGDFSHGTR